MSTFSGAPEGSAFKGAALSTAFKAAASHIGMPDDLLILTSLNAPFECTLNWQRHAWFRCLEADTTHA